MQKYECKHFSFYHSVKIIKFSCKPNYQIEQVASIRRYNHRIQQKYEVRWAAWQQYSETTYQITHDNYKLSTHKSHRYQTSDKKMCSHVINAVYPYYVFKMYTLVCLLQFCIVHFTHTLQGTDVTTR